MSAEETSSNGKANWSSSFARARTEMIVTTVIILAVTHLDMNLSKIPGFGIELAHGAPKATILAFLLLFFAYFLVVFVVKCLAEYRDVQLPAGILSSLEESLKDHVNRLHTLPEPAHAEALDVHVAQLHRAVDEYKQATFKRYEQFLAYLPERWAVTDGNRIDAVDFQHVLASIGKPMDEVARAGVVNAVQAEVDRSKKLNDLNWEQEVIKLNANAEAHLTSVREVIDRFQLNLNSEIAQTQKDIAARAHDVKPILSAIQVDIDKIRSETRNLARALTWDKIVFGFWVPLIFALLAVGFSVPQAIADMKPLGSSIAKCSSPLKENCWYRDPQTPFESMKNFVRKSVDVLK
ncbi:hypothetical protein [Pararhizobium sp.]|uniref:hypothetical protein n=1 Tax=Pararhizobium sp. TaxID=1977563 RepID=UPI003D106077